jgi:histone H1/5
MGGELLEMVEVTEEYAPEIEAATEYFYAEGINEEGLEAIIEEVGLDDFVDFVIDSAQDLNEERAARKMTARNLQTLKKKTIPAAKEAEAKRQKEKKGEYSAAYKKKETDVTVYDKPKAKAKPAAKKPVAKKVAAVTKQVKKLQPAKKASKQGIGDKIRGAIKKGVARHQAARAKGREPEKRVKEFGKGFASGVKGAVKFAGKVKKVVSEEDAQEGKMYGYSGGGLVKKELKDLKKGAETLKGKNIAKADKIEEKNCGCGQTPCITYGKENKFNEAMSAYDKARKAAARRAADRNAARRRGEMGGRMERETYTSEGGTRMHHKGYKAREGE